MQNLVYEWVVFSKFAQIWAKIGSNLRKFGKKLVFLWKFGPKLSRLVYVWVYFQIPWRHIPTKTKLEYPPGTNKPIVFAQVVLKKAIEYWENFVDFQLVNTKIVASIWSVSAHWRFCEQRMIIFPQNTRGYLKIHWANTKLWVPFWSFSENLLHDAYINITYQ